MLGTKLLSTAFKVTRAVQKRIAPTFTKTICSKGNGQRRVIVSGFNGANLDENHFKLLDLYNRLNVRPIIAGFTGQKGMGRRLTATPGCGFTKFFPNFRLPRMSRHVVYDVQTQRQAIKGFSCDTTPEIVKRGTPQTAQTLQRPQIATERIVIQGFGGDTSKPVYKQINPNEKRTVIKGFTA